LLFSIVIFQVTFSQGKIDQSKEELKKENTSDNIDNTETTTTTQGSHSNRREEYKREKDHTFFNLAFNIVSQAVLFATVGSYRYEDHLYNNLSDYPYQNGTSGNYTDYDSISQVKNNFRADFEFSALYESKNLYGYHTTLKIRPFQYFYFQSDYHELIEKTGNDSDRLSVFHFDVKYDRLRFEKLNFGWSLGAIYMGNDVNKWGFHFGVQSDYFVEKNISLSGNANWGRVNQTPVNTTAIAVQYHIKKTYFTVGYEHLRIGSPDYNFIKVGVGVFLP